MIKIVEIKGGLKGLEDQKELTFEDKGFLIGKSRRKGFSGSQGLYEQIRTLERVNVITSAQIEETMSDISSSRENDITIHASAEGYRRFQQALQEEISIQLEQINTLTESAGRDSLRNVIVFGTGGEVTNDRGQIMGSNYTVGFDPYLDDRPLEPLRQVNPNTGNTEILQSNGNSVTFSRDMTEEQMIAYFDSLN